MVDAGPTGCNMTKGDRSVTLDVVKKSLWVDAKAYTTIGGARSADARLVAPVVDGLLEELPSSSGPTTPNFETARAPRGSSAEYLDSSSPVDDVPKRLRELRAPVRSTKAQMWRRVLEKRLNADTWTEKHCLTDDDDPGKCN